VSDHESRGPGRAYRAFLAASLRRPGRAKSPWTDYYRSCLGLGDIPEFRVRALEGTRRAWMLWKVALSRLSDLRLKDASRAFLASAASSRPGDWIAQYRGAETLFCAGEAARAWRAAERGDAMARAAGRFPEALAWKAAMRLWSGDASASLALARRARRGGALYATGVGGAALVLLGRCEEAGPLFDERIASNYHVSETRIWKSEALRRRGRFDEAAAEAARSREGGGDPNFYSWVAEGLARAEGGDERGAAACLEKVPARVRRRVSRLTGARTPRRIFEEILRLSRGVRRSQHELALWLPERVVRPLFRRD